MLYMLEKLRDKEIISMVDGVRLGNVCDLEIDSETGQIASLIIFGEPKYFGFFGREEDIIIPFENVSVIGEDSILVEYTNTKTSRKSSAIMNKLFDIR